MRINSQNDPQKPQSERAVGPKSVIAIKLHPAGLPSVERRKNELGLSRSAYVRHLIALDCGAPV